MGNSVLSSVRLDEGLHAAPAQPCGSPVLLIWTGTGQAVRPLDRGQRGPRVVGLMCGALGTPCRVSWECLPLVPGR